MTWCNGSWVIRMLANKYLEPASAPDVLGIGGFGPERTFSRVCVVTSAWGAQRIAVWAVLKAARDIREPT